jgi:hypothetical protein
MTKRAVLLVMVLLLAGCGAAPAGPAVPSGAAPAARARSAPAGCAYDVRRDVLPAWARAGFTDPSPSGTPYVLSSRGDILGVLFGYPLTTPPRSSGPDNKVLWVSRVPVDRPATLRITARQDGAADPETREVAGGPGPSIVDLPRPGCWHLTLTWSGHTDNLDLFYDA